MSHEGNLKTLTATHSKTQDFVRRHGQCDAGNGYLNTLVFLWRQDEK